MPLKLEMEVWMEIIHRNSLVTQTVHLQYRRPGFDSWVGKSPWRREWQPNSSILAWRIPWTEEPGGVQSLASQKVRHDWKTNASWKWRGSPGERINIEENSSRLYGTCGSSKITPQIHPRPGPWDLSPKRTPQMMRLKILKWEIILDCIPRPNGITRVLGVREKQNG